MYLNLPRDVIRSSALIRLRVHTLRFETAPWSQSDSPTCDLCDTDDIQDKQHVLYLCANSHMISIAANMHLCFPQQEPTILSHNNLLTNEPRDMQIMLSRLVLYARNKHIIVNTSKSEVVHGTSTPRVKMFLILMLAVPPFISHKGYSRHLGMIFYRTFNMAKSAEHVSRPFLASGCL